MFTADIIARYAEVLLWGLQTARQKRYRKQDVVLIQYEPAATALAEELFSRLLDRGINPVQRILATSGMERSFYEKSDRRQLTFLTPGDRELFSALNGRIFLRAPESLTHLQSIDPAKIGRMLVSRKPLRDILDRREDTGIYSWTLCLFPTEELARWAQMDMKDYSAQIIKACFLDRIDPVSEWDRVYREVAEIKRWLSSLKIKRLHVESEAIDLMITVGEQRRWAGISGHNIPSFEIFLSPDWRGTEGTYYANLPSFRSGNYIEGVRMVFTKGRVTAIDADKGADFARKQIAMDRGAAQVGEFSLTDRRFSRIDRFMADTLFDENFGGQAGNCHLAVGSSYTGTFAGDPAVLDKDAKRRLGFNDSALHWDLVNTEEKTITAELTTGKRVVIYDRGTFMR